MPKNRIILVIGFLIALLPALGFPHAWELFFQVVGGLGIVALSVLISVDKRLTQKAKAERRMKRRRAKSESEVSPPMQNYEERQAE
jgi:hypothetical protein